MSDAIHWTIDGRPTRFAGWGADAVAKGGYRDFQGVCLGSEVLRAEQQSELFGWHKNGDPFWYGTLTLDPEITQAGAQVTAEGVFKQQFSTKTGRRFFMTRDERLFKNQENKPYSYNNVGKTYEQKVETGALRWWAPKGEDTAAGDTTGWCFWAKDQVLTHFKASNLDNGGANMGKQDYLPQTAYGPNGTRSTEPTDTIADRIPAGTASIDIDLIQTSGDLFDIEIRRNSGAALAQKVSARLFDIEVRGLATSSEFTLADCLRVLLKLDLREPDIAPSSLDVMPLDFTGTDMDLSLYLTAVGDWWFQMLYKDEAGIVSKAGPWEQTIQVARSRNAQAPLSALRRYNRVRVPYKTTTDDEREAVGVAIVDPFPGESVELIIDELEDAQREGSTFPQDVADTLVERYSKPRRQGTVTLSEARRSGKLISPFEVQPAYLADITDHDPAIPPQRIDVVKWDGSGTVQVDIEQEGSAIRTLKASAAPKKGKKGKGKANR